MKARSVLLAHDDLPIDVRMESNASRLDYSESTPIDCLTLSRQLIYRLNRIPPNELDPVKTSKKNAVLQEPITHF